MCMCEFKYPTKSAFKFLEELRTLFYITFTKEEIDNSYSYSLNGIFRTTLKEKIEFYNKNPDINEEKITNKSNYLDNSEIPMSISSSELLSQRGEEKINLVVTKPEKIDQIFIKPSTSLLSQNVRIKFIIHIVHYCSQHILGEKSE